MGQLWVSEPIERYCCALCYLHLFLSFANKTDLSVLINLGMLKIPDLNGIKSILYFP